MKKPTFVIQDYDGSDKEIVIESKDLRIWVDHDDVDQEVVEAAVERMVEVLNQYY